MAHSAGGNSSALAGERHGFRYDAARGYDAAFLEQSFEDRTEIGAAKMYYYESRQDIFVSGDKAWVILRDKRPEAIAACASPQNARMICDVLNTAREVTEVLTNSFEIFSTFFK